MLVFLLTLLWLSLIVVEVNVFAVNDDTLGFVIVFDDVVVVAAVGVDIGVVMVMLVLFVAILLYMSLCCGILCCFGCNGCC